MCRVCIERHWPWPALRAAGPDSRASRPAPRVRATDTVLRSWCVVGRFSLILATPYSHLGGLWTYFIAAGRVTR